jgi:hypothetical protein
MIKEKTHREPIGRRSLREGVVIRVTMLVQSPAEETHREPIGRRSLREGVAIRVTLVVGSPSVESPSKMAPYPAWMADVSIWGARVKTSVQLPPGQSVALAPAFGTVFPMFPVPGRVVWARKAEFGEDAELGLEFLQPVPIRYWWS